MDRVRAIPLTVGGVVDPANVIGRNGVSAEIFKTFESSSATLTGERRMGKTSLAGLVEREARGRGWDVVSQSAEGYTTVEDFTGALIARLEAESSALRRAMESVRDRWGIAVGPITIDPTAKERLLDEVVGHAVDRADERLLLILDELPILARTLEQREIGAGTNLLHVLRRLRQHHGERLRMLCLGSIGFHHVVQDDRGVLNDLNRHRLGPLAHDDAVYLARGLLAGTGNEGGDPDAVAEIVAREVEDVPYYVHRLIAAASRAAVGGAIDPATIPALVTDAVEGPDDDWDLRHYRDRLGGYYGDDEPLAAAILDVCGSEVDGLSLAELNGRLAVHELAPVAGSAVRALVERLEMDHYLVRSGDRRRFAFSLVRRAWIWNRS